MRKSYKTFGTALAVLVGLGLATQAIAADVVLVGGQAMLPTKDIIDNAVESADHTTLVTAVKTAGLVETLKGEGPFTVFAPTNAAFDKLPEGTVASLLKPESKDALTGILTYHVVAGKFTADAVVKAIKDGGGKAEIPTVAGGKLVAKLNGPKNVIIVDEKGNTANISTYDVLQSNGVIHVVDTVLLPK